MTAAALFGFFFSAIPSSPLCLWAVPYGLGAGSVDAALNNYVALHYTSRHMSWLQLHVGGVGASAGPYIMGRVLSGGASWNTGYRYIGILQVALTAILFLSLPLWRARNVSGAASGSSSGAAIDKDTAEVVDTAKAAYTRKPLSLGQILRIPGAREVMVAFFCYCALEQTTGLWASSYLALHEGISSETAAFYASLFFIGITAGRAASGFLTLRFSDTQMIRLGQGIILLGILILFLPFSGTASLAGLIVIGLGCAPIYPCIIHSTPDHFGADLSQAVIGVQMASAYVGSCLMPPIFGLIANHISIALFPLFLLVILVLMFLMHERLLTKRDVHLLRRCTSPFAFACVPNCNIPCPS